MLQTSVFKLSKILQTSFFKRLLASSPLWYLLWHLLVLALQQSLILPLKLLNLLLPPMLLKHQPPISPPAKPTPPNRPTRDLPHPTLLVADSNHQSLTLRTHTCPTLKISRTKTRKIPMQRLLYWTLILAAFLNWPLASASVTQPSHHTFSTTHNHTPIPPPRARPTPTNQARTPATITQSTPNFENTHHGDCLDDYLDMVDQGKELNEVDPGQGDIPTPVWKEQVLRIYFQNINSIRLDNEGADMLDLFLQMENIRADIFGFSETKLATDQPFVNNLLQKNKRKIWDHASLVTSTSKIVLEGYHKPGGTLTCATNSLVGRIRNTYSDPYGRWSGMELMGRSDKRLVILTVYQVTQKTGTAGNTTAYTQQRNMFRLEDRSNPNPRKILIADLSALVSELHRNDHDIILMGDFND